MTLSFTDTRARTEDPDTSKQAARTAASLKSQLTRALLSQTIRKHDTHPKVLSVCENGTPICGHVIGWTAKELSAHLDIPLPDAYRRLPETGGIKKSQNLRRDGCVVWIAS